MWLTETLESINTLLVNHYGKDDTSGQPMWRVVSADEQYEHQRVEFTEKGVALPYPEVRYVPKYSYIKQRYILEQLEVVPAANVGDIPASPVAYGVKWVFETQNGVYLPPKFAVAKFVIDTIYAAIGKKSMRKYVDREANRSLEEIRADLTTLKDDLFGNETSVGDALAYGSGVSLSGPKLLPAESTQPKE